MDRNLHKLVALLASPDGMRRCAGAIALAELAPKDPAVVKALGEALATANQLLTRYVLEALAAIGTRAVVPHVLPLLNAADMETKMRAVGIVARAGGDVLPDLRKQLAAADPAQKLVLVDVVARIHNREALQVILELLFEPDLEFVKECCQAVRRHGRAAAPRDRLALHQQVVKFMGSARVKKDDRVLTSCLLLIGYLGAPDARKILLQYSTPKNLGYIRRNALTGLKGLETTGTAVKTTALQMVKYLDETDPVIVQHALDIIEKLPLPATFDAQWRKLLQGRHAPVRAFAARKLAAADTPAANRLLLTLLAHEDPQVSDIAASALAHHKTSTAVLLDALAGEKDADKAWRLAKILKPHGPAVDKKAVAKFAGLAAKDLAAGHLRAEAILYFLRHVQPGAADTVLRDAAAKFRKAGQWARAVECLRPLVNTESFDAEARYELSICNLKQSAKDLPPHLRAEDPALRGLHALASSRAFPLLDRLRKEAALEADDVAYVGFHFAELPGDEDNQLGRSLLEHVIKRWPKSAAAKAAKNKLKLTG